ncbi:thioredoxin family protein [Flavobacterium sp. K5-23]|uniref:thioredoxin family protein n=1 Tax=Flavobacterium sp. K5-23 TaxID=2746225 RepID=UPI0020107C58|nr:thioredoxin family protein [Flavobacterium sp. K5-23]UQD55347.1 thioredoxin family protein [Flavobacterium sp. K5-23]
MKPTIAKALFNSYSYSEYRKIVSDLLKDGKSTGNEQSEALTHYSSLNETRLNRLEKTMKVSEENIIKIKSLEKDYIWLVLSEGWCGDAAQIVPIFEKMAAESEGKIDLKIVLRDENEDLMNLFLTNKAKAIPKLIIINKETGGYLGQWGPRPKGATDLIVDYKKEHGVVDETAKANLQLWYLHDKGLSTQEEIIELLQSFDE